MSNDINTWFVNHSEDYESVANRLEKTRTVLLDGSIDAAAEVLEKAYVFAVLSIRTERERHERAFTAYYATDITLKEAALKTVYGGNKKNWLRRTFEETNWTALAHAVRIHAREQRWAVLLDTVVDNLTGVAHRKGAFMLAMSGLYEYGCIDSNVARYADMAEEDGDALSFNSAEEYMETCENVFGTVPTHYPPFIKQWAIYDYERGEHARHMAYFHELPTRT
jgi:hypothetical protein